MRAYSPCRFSVARRPVSPTPQAGQTWSSRMESAPKVAEAKANSGCPTGTCFRRSLVLIEQIQPLRAALRPCNSSRANASSANCCSFRADSPACRFFSRLDRLLSARLTMQLLSDYSFRSCVASSSGRAAQRLARLLQAAAGLRAPRELQTVRSLWADVGQRCDRLVAISTPGVCPGILPTPWA